MLLSVNSARRTNEELLQLVEVLVAEPDCNLQSPDGALGQELLDIVQLLLKTKLS